METLIIVGEIILAAYLTVGITWTLFAAMTHIKKHRKSFPKWLLYHAYALAGIFYVWDVILNWFVLTIVFLDFPREFVATHRLKRLHLHDTSWRRDLSRWMCDNLINYFDPDHC